MRMSEQRSTQPPGQRWRRRGAGVAGKPTWFGKTLHTLLVALIVGVTGYALVVFLRAAAQREAPPVPATMEAVDWNSPDSSPYCLACHRPVGPASAGLDVEHGHPQNVRLSEAQLRVVEEWGTVAGEGGTLICITCHQLGENVAPNMLPVAQAAGEFCIRCHPSFGVDDTPHDLRLTAAHETNRLGQTVAEGGTCSACHLAHRFARDFEPCDFDPAGRCTTCHNVGQCASGHARTTMEHSESLCLDCHNPHDMSHGEFLKAPVSVLCTQCHEGYAAGTVGGMHPVEALPEGIPAEILEAGGWAEPDSAELSCTVCHKIHFAEHAQLLVFDNTTNRLCLACHPDQRGEESTAGKPPRHGQSPRLAPQQLAVAKQWKTPVGENGELLCVTCHQVHHSNAKSALLAFAPQYGEVCAACHPQNNGLFGTAHDLRTTCPDEPNRLGMTALSHGACSACHLAHGNARETFPTSADASGRCISCHRPEACAAPRAVTGVQHTDTTCVDCHNPHQRGEPHFLAKPEAQICADCHPDHLRLIGGPHDLATRPDQWPDEIALAEHGACTVCHVPHGGERGDLFRVHGPHPVGNHDDVCLVCHEDAGWGSNSGIAAIHPQQIAEDQDKVKPALVPHDESGNMRMGCRTCHNPHGGAHPTHLARVKPDEPTESLCLHCHSPKQFVKQTGHSAESLARFGYDVDSCKPCHAMHAKSDGTWGLMLSPRFLVDSANPASGSPHGSALPCLVCHHENAAAPVREIATHPRINLFNRHAPDSPGFLPLFNDAGKVDPSGDIVCRTCHVSHGRLDLLQLVAEKKTMSHAERSAIRSQLRNFETPNLCTDCHGEQARVRFLFFHDAKRRDF
jgi:predicted CXXCH cytochrome family protein